MGKGKKPAFQFYPGDWRRDTQVQMASMGTRGVWFEFLCCMWDAPERGKLEGTKERLAMLIGCSVETLDRALNEIKELKIGDVTNCHNVVTIINRRMFREQNTRKNARLRKQRERERKSGHTGVTPTSSSSSSTSLDLSKDKSPDGEFSSKHFKGKVGEFLQSIVLTCQRIQKLPKKNGRPFNPFQWVQKQVNNNAHPGAIDETLKALENYWDSTEKPYAYADSILKTKDGNWHEKDHIEDHEQTKTMWKNMLADSEELKKLVAGIGG